MKIAACYIRVSTDDQVEYSPESQLLAIREYAKAHDYYIPDEFVFSDEGISGRTVAKRPGFNRMIGIAQQKPKPFEAILLWKFSRFARNRTDAIVYKRLLRDDCGIDVISISENLGEDRGTALILESMFEAMDEYYSLNLSTEVKRSMLMKAEKGEVLGPAPYGYRNENKSFVIDEATAPFVHMVFDQFEAGVPASKIARNLNEAGARTKFGNPFDLRGVVYIARNPVYIGKIRWSKDGQKSNSDTYRVIPHEDENIIISEGTHPKLIDPVQWQRVNEKLNERALRLQRGSRETARHEYALHGLVRCSNCGATLTYSSAKEPALQCHQYGKGHCDVSHHVSLKRLNPLVIEALRAAANDLNFAVVPHYSSEDEADLQALNKVLENNKKRLERARDAFELGIDSAEEYRERKREISEEIKAAKKKIETFERKKKIINLNAYRQKVLGVVRLLEAPTADPKAQNAALRAVIDHIVFNRSTCTVDVIFHA